MSKFKSPLQQAVVTWLTAHPDTTQRKLAEAAEIDHGNISRIVSGAKESLSMESAGRLASAMDITVEDLLAGRAIAAVTAGGAAGAEEIALDLIDPSPHNPRKTFDEDELADLAASIAEQGLLQPLVVMRSLTKGRYELIAGHRRLRALQKNGAAKALCIVRMGTTATSRALQIIENLQRVDIAPLEEAQAFADLQDENKTHWTAAAIGRATGKSDRFVAQRIAIARNLVPELKESLAAGDLKVEVARVLAAAPARLQKEVAKNHWAINSADSARSFMLDKAVPLGKAAFKVDLYDGEFIEDGERKWFADAGKFDRLQKKAAEAKVERLKKEWPTAALVGATDLNGYVWADDGTWVNPYYLQRSEAKERRQGLAKEDCTALVFLKDHDIKVLKNVVKREVFQAKAEKARPDPDDDDVGDDDAAYKANQAEITALNDRLAQGVAGRPDIAKRLVIYAFLGNLISLDVDEADVLEAAGPWAELLAEFLPSDGNPSFSFYDPDAADENRLWALLAAQDEATIDAMVARFLARSVQFSPWRPRATGLHRALAGTFGIVLPPLVMPVAETDETDAADEAASDEVADA